MDIRKEKIRHYRHELPTGSNHRIFSDPAGGCIWITPRTGDSPRGRVNDLRQESPIIDTKEPPR